MKAQLLVGGLALALTLGGGFAAAGQARARPGGGGSSMSSGQSSGGGHAVPRGGGGSAPSGGSMRGAPASAPAGARSAPGTGGGRSAPSGSSVGSHGGGDSQRVYTGGYARPRDGRYVTGTAVPRGSVHPAPPINVYPPSWMGSWYYPYYPYGYGMWGFGWYYYDPWYWGYPGWGWGPYGNSVYVTGYGYPGVYAGAVRLKVKPRDAQVFVDGYYVGIVDEFDGTFQELRLEEGPHAIEVKKEGFAPLEFKVRVTFDHTMTLRGELKPTGPPQE